VRVGIAERVRRPDAGNEGRTWSEDVLDGAADEADVACEDEEGLVVGAVHVLRGSAPACRHPALDETEPALGCHLSQ
jgi:hypothetical protein